MSNNIKEVVLTLKKEKSRLLRKGEYTVAKVKVKYPRTKYEEFALLSPSKIIAAPVFEDAIQVIHLSEQFVDYSISNMPNVMGRFKGNLRTWKRLNTKEKLQKHCEEIALDARATIYSIEYLED